MTDLVARMIERLGDWCHDLAERIEGEQCPHFLVRGGDKYVGTVYCQKTKGHWFKHRTYNGEKF